MMGMAEEVGLTSLRSVVSAAPVANSGSNQRVLRLHAIPPSPPAFGGRIMADMLAGDFLRILDHLRE